MFARDNGGFDAIVGNPPFAGKNTITGGNSKNFLPWLQTLHQGAHGNADLVAHFFRRAFCLLRVGGVFGLIATNTIGQGDTRASGLTTILSYGGAILRATRRLKWPGEAAVVVSVVHVAKGAMIRTVLGAALETFLVSTLVGVIQLVVKLPVLAVTIVVIVVRQRGRDGRGQQQHRCRYESFIQGHDTSPLSASPTLLNAMGLDPDLHSKRRTLNADGMDVSGAVNLPVHPSHSSSFSDTTSPQFGRHSVRSAMTEPTTPLRRM